LKPPEPLELDDWSGADPWRSTLDPSA